MTDPYARQKAYQARRTAKAARADAYAVALTEIIARLGTRDTPTANDIRTIALQALNGAKE